MNYTEEVAETFGDVAIIQKYSDIDSRTKIDLTTDFNSFKLTLPIISSNMIDITEGSMMAAMHSEGGLGILHRFGSIEDSINQFKKAGAGGVSIGIQEHDKKVFEDLYLAGVRIFCIDVAHGYQLNVKNMLHWINSTLFRWDRANRNKVCIIAGNIATAEGVYDLTQWGADVVKIGIGPGSVCQTRQRTGVGTPQLYALKQAREEIRRQGLPTKIIADGGITSTGDIAKALKYADAVMLGAILAGTTETPGNVYPVPGTNLANRTFYKVYGGSASMETKIKAGQPSKFVEGEIKTVPFKGHVKYILREIREGLQSSFSYVGARNLPEFQEKCEFLNITNAGKFESKI